MDCNLFTLTPIAIHGSVGFERSEHDEVCFSSEATPGAKSATAHASAESTTASSILSRYSMQFHQFGPQLESFVLLFESHHDQITHVCLPLLYFVFQFYHGDSDAYLESG
jgi:hypothetical protein